MDKIRFDLCLIKVEKNKIQSLISEPSLNDNDVSQLGTDTDVGSKPTPEESSTIDKKSTVDPSEWRVGDLFYDDNYLEIFKVVNLFQNEIEYQNHKSHGIVEYNSDTLINISAQIRAKDAEIKRLKKDNAILNHIILGNQGEILNLEKKLQNALDPRGEDSELVAGQRIKSNRSGELGTIVRVDYSADLCPFKVVFDGYANYEYTWLSEYDVTPINRFIGVDINTGNYLFEDIKNKEKNDD